MKELDTNKATRRDIQKVRSKRYQVKTSITELQKIVLSRRYPNLKPHEMVDQAVEEIINLQLAKEEKAK